MGLGLHGGGVGSAAFFARLGSRVIMTDLKTKKELAPSIVQLRRWKNIQYHLGGHRPYDFRNTDYVIKGPGVPESSKYLKIAERAGVDTLSDVEIFFLICPAPIIGITGTKGKTTATRLLGNFLKQGLKKRIWVGGNIRKSMMELLPRVRKNDLVVLELSSFQLDSLKNQSVSPHIALVTNVFADHLNRYASMGAYAASKSNIFKNQKKEDYLFINGRDKFLRRMAKKSSSRLIHFDPKEIALRFKKSLSKEIPAYHMPSIAAAIVIAKHTGVGDRAIRTVLKNFRGVPNRMEIVRVMRGVTFINDTTATNPTAAEHAVISTKKRIGKSKLYVIAGGYDKKLAVDNFAKVICRNAASVVFLPGTATLKIKSRIQNLKCKILRVVDARSMTEAVRIACRNAGKGDVVLLSPGAASFGLFKHEFDRGEQFVKAVKKLRP